MNRPRTHRWRRLGRLARGAALGVLLVVLGWAPLIPAVAAGPNPSLDAFHILDQISPADRGEIVRSVRETLPQDEPGASHAPAGLVRFVPGDVVWLSVRRPGPQTEDSLQWLRVDPSGAVLLADGRKIMAAGLAPDALADRLAALPEFAGAQLVVHRLPAQSWPRERPFGDDLFLTGHSPWHDAPLPAGYLLAPGDRLAVRWSGATLTATVGPDGRLLLKKLGSIRAAGRSLDALQAALRARLRRSGGARLTVALVRLHQVRILVLGDVRRPGEYFLSPLAHTTDALFAAGGPTREGSLRRIQLRRAGRKDAAFDLYALLLKGDTSQDRPLVPGEVVFVPPRGPVVQLEGEVLRPGRYELAGDVTLAQALALAGGTRSQADLARATISRAGQDGARTLYAAQRLPGPLQDGDRIEVPAAPYGLRHAVWLEDGVHAPEARPWQSGIRLDALLTAAELRGHDRHFVLILHHDARGHARLVAADPSAAALRQPDTADPVLAPADRLFLFPETGSRLPLLRRVVAAARARAGVTHYVPSVRIEGAVRYPGRWPLAAGLTERLLVAAAGGLTRAPGALRVEVLSARGRIVQEAALAHALDPAATRTLHAGETVRVLTAGERRGMVVGVAGAVRDPGRYVLADGATIGDAVAAAGGARGAAVLAAVYDASRAAARREDRTRLLERAAKTLSAEEFQRIVPLGRRAISGQVALTSARLASLQHERLQAGMEVMLSPEPTTVQVVGFVRSPGSFRDRRVSLASWLRRAGGVTAGGDPSHLLLAHDNGRLVPVVDHWFYHTPVRPGDVLIVPPRLDSLADPTERSRLRRRLAQTLLAGPAPKVVAPPPAP